MEIRNESRNPRAHGTREGSFNFTVTNRSPVAIHVLMEHVKAPKHRRDQCQLLVAIHVLMEHVKALFICGQGCRTMVAIHVLMEHVKAPTPCNHLSIQLLKL